LGNFKDWEEKIAMSCWATPEANAIQGGDATAFYPGIDEQDTPEVFVDNLFRSSTLSARGTISLWS
jgi:hypothetical protein